MTYLERHQVEENIHRFYLMDVSQDLFGLWLLVRRWGRVGQGRGQSLVCSFPSKTEALGAQEKLKVAKCKRGYTQ